MGGVLINGNLAGYVSNGKFVYESAKPVLDSVEITGFTLPGNKKELIRDYGKTKYQKGDSEKSRISIRNGYSQNMNNFTFGIVIHSASLNYEKNEVGVKRYRETSYSLPSVKYNVLPGNISMQYTESTREYDTEYGIISSNRLTSGCWRNASLTIMGGYPSCVEKKTAYANDGCENEYVITINVETSSVNACIDEFMGKNGLLNIGVTSDENTYAITETFQIPLYSGMIGEIISV